MTESVDFDEIVEVIKLENDFVVVTHISPDPDAIGSSVALALALRAINKTAIVYFPELPSDKLSYFIPEGLIFKGSEKELQELFSKSTLIGVDCATKKRLGESVNLNFSYAKKSLNIDHHESNEKWGNSNWVESTTAATAVMITKLLEFIDITVTKEIADLLYAGILDDTGSFRYSNTNVECLEYAADLVQSGASPSEISKILYFEIPEKVLRLRAKCLNNLEIFGEGRISLIYLTNDILNEFQCNPDDSEGLVDIARSIEGIKLSFFMREIEGGFKVSARSKDEKINVNDFASKFGGGGHKAASGFTLKLDLESALQTLRTESSEFLA